MDRLRLGEFDACGRCDPWRWQTKKTADEWVVEIRNAGVPIGPVNTLADARVLSSGMLKLLASPLLVDGERLPIRHPPPTLGQHTEETSDGEWS